MFDCADEGRRSVLYSLRLFRGPWREQPRVAVGHVRTGHRTAHAEMGAFTGMAAGAGCPPASLSFFALPPPPPPPPPPPFLNSKTMVKRKFNPMTPMTTTTNHKLSSATQISSAPILRHTICKFWTARCECMEGGGVLPGPSLSSATVSSELVRFLPCGHTPCQNQ